MPTPDLRLRDAAATDLDALNALVTRAVQGWDLPARVERLALPGYLYDLQDLAHMHLRIAEDTSGRLLGVAALDDAGSAPDARLLHGIFVDPDHQHAGIGRQLVDDALAHAAASGAGSLLVRAQRQACGFFERLGFTHLPVTDPDRDYPHRYRKRIPT